MVSMTARSLKQLFRRITLNRLSFSFFIFTFVTSFAQGILHSLLFSVDSDYNEILYGITQTAKLPPANHTDLIGGSGYWNLNNEAGGELTLIMCDNVPKINCFDLFQSSRDTHKPPGKDENATLRGEFVHPSIASHSQVTLWAPDAPPKNAGDVAVIVKTGLGTVPLNLQCAQILNYPQQHMHNARREDLSLVIFQFWLFAMSIYAMIRESVPHILATLFARVLLLGWSSYAIMRTHHQKLVFDQLVERDGSPCSFELFTGYFVVRFGYEIADIILNTTACVTAVYLSWTLLQVYNSQSFKCVGAPEEIMKLHKYVLGLLAVLHLALFVILSAVGLWIDQLFNSYIKEVSEHTPAYIAGFICVCLLVSPWIAAGYNATTRERPRVMLAFIVIASLLLLACGIMFYSKVYLWTFINWPYIGCYMVASFLLIFLSIGLAIICRMNFGKGLAQYLRAEALLAKSDFRSEVFEHDAEKAMSSDDALPSPVSSTYKTELTINSGVLLFSPGMMVSPASPTTKETQEFRGERESHYPIPIYQTPHSRPPLYPKRRESDDSI
jgi:hypothetical protein